MLAPGERQGTMQFYKLRWDYENPSITYHHKDGTSVTIKEGDVSPDGKVISKEDIHIVVSLHNQEIRNNNKHIKAPMTDQEKADLEEWKEAHPGEKPPKKYHASLDAFFGADDEMDRSAEMYAAVTYNSDSSSAVADRVWALIEELTDIQREALVLRYFADMPVKDIAKKLNKSEAAISRAIGRAKDYIKANY